MSPDQSSLMKIYIPQIYRLWLHRGNIDWLLSWPPFFLSAHTAWPLFMPNKYKWYKRLDTKTNVLNTTSRSILVLWVESVFSTICNLWHMTFFYTWRKCSVILGNIRPLPFNSIKFVYKWSRQPYSFTPDCLRHTVAGKLEWSWPLWG